MKVLRKTKVLFNEPLNKYAIRKLTAEQTANPIHGLRKIQSDTMPVTHGKIAANVHARGMCKSRLIRREKVTTLTKKATAVATAQPASP